MKGFSPRMRWFFWPYQNGFILQNCTGNTVCASHESCDQQPDVDTGTNHKDDDDRKCLEDDGTACCNDLLCEQTYLFVILTEFLIYWKHCNWKIVFF